MTEISEKRSVRTGADFEFPVETVWQALTKFRMARRLVFPNDIQPVVGHKFTIWGRPIERWDGEFRCEVLEVEAPHMISFRWYGGHEELKAFGRYMDTKVTWTLSPLPNGGTHFDFVHEGFATDPQSDALFDVMFKGSESVLRTLTKRLPDLVKYGA